LKGFKAVMSYLRLPSQYSLDGFHPGPLANWNLHPTMTVSVENLP
jgi:hypothetical protein